MTEEQIRENFRHHPPKDAGVANLHREIQELAIEATVRIARLIKPSRERSLFITHMQDAKMWANTALACHGPAGEPGDE